MSRFLFPLSLFLSALLLFSIQPMVAKALLPVYGGTPAVWIVCMLFFQLILLTAYAYVWGLSLFNKQKVWGGIHLFLVLSSLLSLPLTFHTLPLNNHPEWEILYNLLSQLGLPLLVIGASAPLLQFAYSQTTNKGASDPYFLYTASNLGSLIALLIYPFVIERFIGLLDQFHFWRMGYFLYLALLTLVFIGVKYKPLERQPHSSHDFLPWVDMMYWVFLSFVPCSLMLGVTLYITTDVAATPLFWVLPLIIYLFSFIVTFTTKPFIKQEWVVRNCLVFLVFTILGFILGINQVKAWQLVLFNLASFFILAILCHGQLFYKRPKPQSLTLFYFCLSLGGVLAGVFNSLIAPHFFDQVYEYPIAILCSLLALPPFKKKQKMSLFPIVLGLLVVSYFIPEAHWFHGMLTPFQLVAILILIMVVLWSRNKADLCFSLLFLFAFIFLPVLQKNHLLLQERNFYGVKQVVDKSGAHVLISQSTVHGVQDLNQKGIPRGDTSYYGGVNSLISSMQKELPSMHVTEIGLGTGTILCQFRAQDAVRVIEIDPQMIALAENPQLFTYVRDCLPHKEIIKADGRLSLAQVKDKSQDLIIMDAFNSDAVPVHLLTEEAFNLYKEKITAEGVILINLSNRHINLFPVVNAAGRTLEMMVFYLIHHGDPKLGQFDSEWALLTTNDQLVASLMNGTYWHFLAQGPSFLWTDDYSNIIPLLK